MNGKELNCFSQCAFFDAGSTTINLKNDKDGVTEKISEEAAGTFCGVFFDEDECGVAQGEFCSWNYEQALCQPKSQDDTQTVSVC